MTTGTLAPLAGSPKQIAWATDIRQFHIDDFARQIPAPAPLSRSRFLALYQERFAALLAARGEARWWIEHRDMDLRNVLRTRNERFGGADGAIHMGDEDWTPESV